MKYMAQMGRFEWVDGGDTVVAILASTRCRYKALLTFPDEVVVRARVVTVGRTSFTLEYRVWSTRLSCVSAIGEGIVVCIEKASGTPVEVPPEMRPS